MTPYPLVSGLLVCSLLSPPPPPLFSQKKKKVMREAQTWTCHPIRKKKENKKSYKYTPVKTLEHLTIPKTIKQTG